jgi:hypothetical protein
LFFIEKKVPVPYFFLYKKIFFVILSFMDEYKNNVNPFTNQPIIPPNPPFNPPGEAKPPAPEKEAAKPVKKFGFKILFLYIILVALGGVLAKYSFDFFAPKKQANSSAPRFQSVTSKPASQPLIRFIPSKTQAAPSSAAEKKQEQPLVSIKKKINQTMNPYDLSGIFFSGAQSYCIINDKVLGIGDSVEGAKVVRIDPDEVELQLNDKSIKLNLRGK